MNTLSLSRLGSNWANTIHVNASSASRNAQTAQPDPAPNVDQPTEPPERKLSPHQLALLQLRDTIAKFDVLRFRSMFDLFKSIPAGIQSPSTKQATEAYKNQMVLQK